MLNKKMHLFQLRTITLAAAAIVTIALCAPNVQAQSSFSKSNQVVLSAGTVIPVNLNTEISSNGSNDGDTFTATVDNSKDVYNNIMQGATVTGIVRHATPRDGDKPGTLELGFTSLHLSNGQTYPITGTLTSLDTKALKTGANGILLAKTTSKDQRLTYAGIGAGAGALASILGGHKLKIEDVIIGGIAGYGAAALLNGPSQVHDVDLKPGMPMGVLLNNRVRYFHHPQQAGTIGRATGSHHTYVVDGVKHYWLNGQEWTMDLTSGERNRVGVAVQGIALLALDGAVGAHPFGVVGPFAWAARTGAVSHVTHFRTCVYP